MKTQYTYTYLYKPILIYDYISTSSYMENYTLRLYNEIKGIFEEDVTEYYVENYYDLKEFVEFLKNIKEEVNEAEYQGRKVKLNKPMRGDVKKFKVYVKNPKGNVVKVNFGHGGTSAKAAGEETMRIKKSDPERRASFRARHNCDTPGPKTGARYWSCKAW